MTKNEQDEAAIGALIVAIVFAIGAGLFFQSVGAAMMALAVAVVILRQTL